MSIFAQPGEIVSLLNEPVKPIFLLGAGASKQSGVKLVAEIVEEAAKWAYCKTSGISVDDPRVTMSDWKKWLTSFPWYIEDSNALYPIIIEQLLTPRQYRKDFFLKIVNPNVPASKGYEVMASLMAMGLIDTVLTTNFDNCLHEAKIQIRRPSILDLIKTPTDLQSLFTYTPRYPRVIYLHGSVEHYTDLNLENEVQSLNSDLVNVLKPLFKDRPLVVIGYRGSEPSIMKNLLIDNLAYANNFRQGIFWCLLKRDLVKDGQGKILLPPLVQELADKTEGNFKIVLIDGFDELMTKEIQGRLEANKIDLKNNTSSYPLNVSETDNKGVFANNTLGPLEIALMRERIKNYSERLHIKVYDDEDWLYQQAVRLRIAEAIDANSFELTFEGIILFSSKIQEYLKNAFVVLRFSGSAEWLAKITSFPSEKDSDNTSVESNVIERTITGNLWSQLNEITDSLALINRPFRLKGEISENVYPYPTLALKEIIVNSLVHRDYRIDKPIVIEITENFILFQSPGGLVEEVKRQLGSETLEDDIRKGKKGIKGYRNPVLADLFYGSGAMDKEGSGLSDVLTQVTLNSSSITFGPTFDEGSFEVKIYRRLEEVDPHTLTATPLIVNQSSKFAFNLLEVQKLPEKIYYADTQARRHTDINKILEKNWRPPFLLSRDKIWSFYDLTEWQNPLRKCIDLGTAESMSIDEFIDLTGGTNDLVRMLNDCLAEHLFSIGLRVDTKKKRAYFTKSFDGSAKEISYQGRLKKATRTVAKPRINATTEKVYYWEHKSIWYHFEKLGDNWYLIINPAYVFTTDGVKNLLRSERVNVLSTKKASRDYNMHVHNDFTFWARYLSQGYDSFLLRINNKEINEGTMLGPIQPEIVISSLLPTFVIDDISVAEEFIEPVEQIDIEEIENEIEQLAKEEQENHEE